MPGTSAISTLDLSQLPAPDVVEALDFETIFAAMLADLRARDATFDALVESDPAYKILEVAAYRELLIRARVNDAARAVMLAFATGTDLDHIGATRGVVRLTLDPGDVEALPPVLPTYESDANFRQRIQLAPEGYTTAGSEGSYIFHGLGASALVKDIQAVSPDPGEVTVYVLSREGDGSADGDLIDVVTAALSAETVRPLTDNVTVLTADVTTYSIVAELVMYPGPDAEVVRAAAEAAAAAYAAAVHRIGYDVTLSGLYAALHQPGVQKVNLTAPVADIVATDGEASFADAITVTLAGATDV
ncbi:baseplate assembly protein [Novosphingobium aquae]|uniref:Baseplate J/gp47 family protein n=1 Tax=Novosphingobium aquae TaxID=3133435 RepID=A0ABU8S439_9SPHN